MAIKSHLLQAHFARRREVEHERVERTTALHRYYDHWGKVNPRFESWTNPEYYKGAEEQQKQIREKKEKAKELCERRERLKNLLKSENDQYDNEIKIREMPKSRKIPATNEQLMKIEQSQKERANIKRKLDLEAKLYGRWRHGVDDENLLFESKSTNETLAKLNWLDKKVEEQLAREREEEIAQDRKLQLQREISRTEEAQKERQLIREKEIKEIRSLQETHMNELKSAEAEAEKLKEEEDHLRRCLNDLEKERELLDESTVLLTEPSDISSAFNLKKIKFYIRKRSELFTNQLRLYISILERVEAFTTRPDDVKKLIAKHKDYLDVEAYTLERVEGMYESEAKSNLQRLEAEWLDQHLREYRELKNFLADEQVVFGTRMQDNLKRQTDLHTLRGVHVSGIENLNEKIKQLVAEAEQSPRNMQLKEKQIDPPFPNTKNNRAVPSVSILSPDCLDATSTKAPPRNDPQLNQSQVGMFGTDNHRKYDPNTFQGRTRTDLQPSRPASTSGLSKMTNSFSNLNLDVWQDVPSPRGGVESPRIETQRSLNVVTPDTAERPKYARKRVAWT